MTFTLRVLPVTRKAELANTAPAEAGFGPKRRGSPGSDDSGESLFETQPVPQLTKLLLLRLNWHKTQLKKNPTTFTFLFPAFTPTIPGTTSLPSTQSATIPPFPFAEEN